MNAASHPYLRQPLDGVQLIEASAGTGKTFTLATLVCRLVVEQGLRIDAILAVTFTDAATQELRSRIRQRLMLAAQLVEAAAQASDADTDALGTERALTLQILRARLATGKETAAQLALRLQQAAEQMDLAAIFTIHGFCLRVLNDYALQTAHSLQTVKQLGSSKPLHAQLAADIWREFSNPAEDAPGIDALWDKPESLQKDIDRLLQPIALFPPDALPDDTGAPRRAFDNAVQQMHALYAQHLQQAKEGVFAALQGGQLPYQKADSFEKAFAELQQAIDSGQWAAEKYKHLDKLSIDFLREKVKNPDNPQLQSPLFFALQQVFEAQQVVARQQQQHAVHLLHQLRQRLQQRLQQAKQQAQLQSFDDLIDKVFAALQQSAQAQVLVPLLRAQYQVALVDEFQDTDARQWQIFNQVFGTQAAQYGFAPALFLIGDPKQAIYGFRGGDVHTYLQAKQQAQIAPRLDRNFRSRPALLKAIASLYQGREESAFFEDGIAFEPVQSGDTLDDQSFLLNDMPAPALCIQKIPHCDGDAVHKPQSKEESRAAMLQSCVAQIHHILQAGQQNKALLRDNVNAAYRPVQAGDIAVLVARHQQAQEIQQALATVGIDAVASGKMSIFESAQADELRSLLLALLHPADERRLRTALATQLLGWQALQIAALDTDANAQREAFLRLHQWRKTWKEAGIYALVNHLCASEGARLLRHVGGERVLTNFLQLAELLQQASAQVLGQHGLLHWLEQQIAQAHTVDESDAETELLRLESDAQRVQIMTIHKSKGLEFPLVFLPFIADYKSFSAQQRNICVRVGGELQLHWKFDKTQWDNNMQRYQDQQKAEQARLLYVALTRASHGLWLASGDKTVIKDVEKTAQFALLQETERLAAQPQVVVQETLPPPPSAPLRAAITQQLAPPRRVLRPVQSDWWVHSFSQLTRHRASYDSDASAFVATQAADDEPANLPLTSSSYDARFAGTEFGNVLHQVLENTAFCAWQGWQLGQPAPPSEQLLLEKSLRDYGVDGTDLDDGMALLTDLIGRTLTTPLPEGDALCTLAPSDYRAEIEFHFAMAATRSQALLELLHQYGISNMRNNFGVRNTLEGLMVGKIDLTYTRHGRWYVLDYKSNYKDDYSPDALAQAMRDSEYDLQALIYTLALHRWLRLRLGKTYDYARDFGGVRYLFCRGLEPTQVATSDSAGQPVHRGVFAQQFAPELVHALDQMLQSQPQQEHIDAG